MRTSWRFLQLPAAGHRSTIGSMHGFKYVPHLEVLRFLDACETFLTFKKEQGGLTSEEEEALRSCMDKIHALADRRRSE